MQRSPRGCGASTCSRDEAQLDQVRGKVPGQGREKREILLSTVGCGRRASHLNEERGAFGDARVTRV
jgi:hypothetical protein